MFDLLISDEFQAGFDALPSSTRSRAERALSRLAENYAHPSLEAHRLQTAPDKWECKFTEGDRIIFEPVDASIRLWAIGNHSIIDRVRNRSFAATTAFHRMEETPVEIGQQQFLAPADWTVPKSQEGGASRSSPSRGVI